MMHLALFGHGRWGKNISRTLGGFPDVRHTVVVRGEVAPTDIDGVIVATPISTHEKIALPYIRKGIPVFIEKPLAQNAAACKHILDAARKSKSLVHVGHIHMHNPAFIKAQGLTKSLGSIRLMTFEGLNNGPYRSDASVLADWLPHPLSMVLTLVNVKPVSAQAWGIDVLHHKSKRLHDVGVARFTFANGVELLCIANWLSPEKRTKLTIIGKKKSLAYFDSDPQKLWLYENFGPKREGKKLVARIPEISNPEHEPGSPLERELRAFVEAVQRKSIDFSQVELGLRIVKMIDAAQESAIKGGKKVQIRI